MHDPGQDLDVVILAGGPGTRLQSVPGNIPKAVRPVGGRPFLFRLLDQARDFGVRRVVLALGFRHEEILRCLGTRPPDGLDLRTSIEPTPLGTGGGLRRALPHLSAGTVMVMNGDSFVDADFTRLVETHRANDARHRGGA
jgi:NDP-sugar pyrophosphorylase family protein